MEKNQLFELESNQNEILLNPRWPKKDYQSLFETAAKAQEQWGLKGHVWIATSGSTAAEVGGTKIVALSKSALRASAEAVNRHLLASEKETWIQVLPHFHVGGLGIEVRALLSGARVVSGFKEDRWEALHFYETLKAEKVTLAALVPTQIFDLVMTHQLSAPPDLRAVVIGGGPLAESLYTRARERGWPLLPSYGMTETASQIATASLSTLTQQVFPAVELLDHAQARQAADGHLEVRADSLLTCYARQHKDQSPEIWDPKIQGWFKTEDKGIVQDRSLIIQGRSQDYIKIGGEATNIAHLRALLDAKIFAIKPDWVSQIALIDVPSERLGAEIHLATTLNESQARQVQEVFAAGVRPFEKIRHVHCLSVIPRSDLGKIKWGVLRSLCETRR